MVFLFHWKRYGFVPWRLMLNKSTRNPDHALHAITDPSVIGRRKQPASPARTQIRSPWRSSSNFTLGNFASCLRRWRRRSPQKNPPSLEDTPLNRKIIWTKPSIFRGLVYTIYGSSWWFFTNPIWNILQKSNWVHLTHKIGWKFKKKCLSCHHLD